MVFASANGWLLIFLGELIVGYSMGLINSNLPTWLVNEVSQHVRGRANGIFVTMMFLGQFSTSLVFLPIINSAGYRLSYLFGAAVIFLTGLGALLLRKKKVITEEIS